MCTRNYTSLRNEKKCSLNEVNSSLHFSSSTTHSLNENQSKGPTSPRMIETINFSSSKNQELITTVVKFRPETEKELERNQAPIYEIFENQNIETKKKKIFSFDRVFDKDSTQQEIFDYKVRDIIENGVLQGYNGSIIVYGQTGTGKTYTMFGKNLNNESRGLVPRAMDLILSKKSDNFSITCKVTQLENEKFSDVLDPKSQNLGLKLKEIKKEKFNIDTENSTRNPISRYAAKKKKGTFQLENLKELPITSQADIEIVLQNISKYRTQASTKSNKTSSRSHLIIMITVKQKLADGRNKIGTLYLVDLAGSEKLSQSGGEIRKKEAISINISLFYLGKLISELSNFSIKQVSYYGSNLTKILQNAIGGNSKTVMIFTCSPSSVDEDETYNTLVYASKARKIKNKAELNDQTLTKAEYCKIIEEYQLIITDLLQINDAQEKRIQGLGTSNQELRNRIQALEKIDFHIHKMQNNFIFDSSTLLAKLPDSQPDKPLSLVINDHSTIVDETLISSFDDSISIINSNHIENKVDSLSDIFYKDMIRLQFDDPTDNGENYLNPDIQQKNSDSLNKTIQTSNANQNNQESLNEEGLSSESSNLDLESDIENSIYITSFDTV